MRILLLGGTAEGRELAGLLASAGHEVVTSVAGRTREAREAEGSRVGGFGGASGLADYLSDPATRVDAVVDATHPFAAQISWHAAQACAGGGLPLLRLSRPGWGSHPQAEEWTWVDDHRQAAVAAGLASGRVLLTVGRQPLPTYHALSDVLARVAEWLGGPVPAGWRILAARGPFDLAAERSLLAGEQITLLVSKDSGGDQTAAKLVAAHELGVAVVMVRRPASPEGVLEAPDVAGVLAWLARL